MGETFQLQPFFLYGTAWKEAETESLTFQALEAGFRGIDTANQRRHYFEEAVGQGIDRFLQQSGLKRESLFIQTKFTSSRGQDHRKPYNERAAIAEQVRQSFESSLQHLRTDYIDSLVLHGPTSGRGLVDEDWEAWRAMEAIHEKGQVRQLGLSNCQIDQLMEFYEGARIKPRFLQNRCYAAMLWDRDNRNFCREQGMIYQGFSLLTANAPHVTGAVVGELAKKYRKTPPQIIFRFARDIGMLPLTGTTQKVHMVTDLDIEDFELTESEIAAIERIAR